MMNILFVCVGNAARSQMAEGFARHYGNKNLTIYSAGSRPASAVHSLAIKLMKEKGINIAQHVPKGFDSLPPIEWDYLITMGCGDVCPFVPAQQRLDWNLPDPVAMNETEFRQVRNQIERLVIDLLQASH